MRRFEHLSPVPRAVRLGGATPGLRVQGEQAALVPRRDVRPGLPGLDGVRRLILLDDGPQLAHQPPPGHDVGAVVVAAVLRLGRQPARSLHGDAVLVGVGQAEEHVRELVTDRLLPHARIDAGLEAHPPVPGVHATRIAVHLDARRARWRGRGGVDEGQLDAEPVGDAVDHELVPGRVEQGLRRREGFRLGQLDIAPPIDELDHLADDVLAVVGHAPFEAEVSDVPLPGLAGRSRPVG